MEVALFMPGNPMAIRCRFRSWLEVGRWASKHPSSELQAVFLFDEADMYLPAQRQPATKGPMEDLRKRARSAGIGLLLASQSPGDFDYKCRDNIHTWSIGKIKEPRALEKQTGHFHLLQQGQVTGLRTDLALVPPKQLPGEEILELAKASRS